MLYTTTPNDGCCIFWSKKAYSDIKGKGYVGTLTLPTSDSLDKKAQQTMIDIEEMLDLPVSQSNLFATLNTFKTKYRRVFNIDQLRAQYIDLDPYHLGLDKEETLKKLQKDVFGKITPYPTEVVDSGKGFYLIWLIEPEDATYLPRWNRIQRTLHNLLARYGSDAAALDAARVLRVPGSINAKANVQRTVRVRNIGSDITYSIEQLEDFLGLKGKALPVYIDKKPKNKKSVGTKKKKYVKSYVNGVRHGINKRIAGFKSHDIRLILLHKKRNAIGLREKGLFLYRHYLLQQGESQQYALDATLELNHLLAVPLSIKEVTNATKSPLGAWYNISVQQLYEEFGVTEDMETELLIIISEKEKKRRRRKSYGRTNSKKEEIMIKKQTLQDLRRQGHSVKEICSMLEISKTSYYRLKRGLSLEPTVEEATNRLQTSTKRPPAHIRQEPRYVEKTVVKQEETGFRAKAQESDSQILFNAIKEAREKARQHNANKENMNSRELAYNKVIDEMYDEFVDEMFEGNKEG